MYGGQAVLEGVLIRGQRYACVAVRRPDGSIASKTNVLDAFFTKWPRKVPFIRGVVVLIETLALGMKALTYSANVGLESEDEEIGKGTVIMTVAISVLFATGLFFIVPVLVSRPAEGVFRSDMAANIIEGVVRLAIFLGYIVVIGRLGQIKRLFMYHGAEHMTIHALEHTEDLSVEAIRKYPTAHPRCGTAFLLTVMIVSIVVFMFIGRDPLWWLIMSRIVLIPFVTGISYEVTRLSGFYSGNLLVRLASAPSLALQALTTLKPNDDQIEVAVAAMTQTLKADGVLQQPGAAQSQAPQGNKRIRGDST